MTCRGVGQASRPVEGTLKERSRTSPSLGATHQPRPNRVVLDVRRNPDRLPPIADPAVEGFTLQKGTAMPAEYFVGHLRRVPLDAACELRERYPRLTEKVDMVRHDHPGGDIAKPTLALGIPQGVSNSARHTRIGKPKRSPRRPIQLPILGVEPGSSSAGLLSCEPTSINVNSMQPECNEYGDVARIPMRQTAPIKFAHKSVRRTGVPRYLLVSGARDRFSR
jgi:hypothetical protein